MSNFPEKNHRPAQNITRRASRAGMGGGAILIGLALYMVFRGFGPGGTGSSGSGTGPENQSPGKALITSATSANPQHNATKKAVAAPDPETGGLSDDERKALSGTVFTVLIDEHSYLIELPGKPDPVFRPTSLDRVVQLAKVAEGDSNGIKVRVLRRENARASAEFDLKAELERNGIRQDAIVMPSEFIP